MLFLGHGVHSAVVGEQTSQSGGYCELQPGPGAGGGGGQPDTDRSSANLTCGCVWIQGLVRHSAEASLQNCKVDTPGGAG